jgi:hypothetical protein
MEFFRVFNAFQITALFAGMPFLVGWLWNASFSGATPLAWVSTVAYVIFFFLMVGAVVHSAFED